MEYCLKSTIKAVKPTLADICGFIKRFHIFSFKGILSQRKALIDIYQVLYIVIVYKECDFSNNFFVKKLST